MKNEFKKQDANGNQLGESIGKGIDEKHVQKVMDARKNDALISFKLPTELKKEFINNCGNPSELLRAFCRGFVQQRKNPLG